VGWRKRTWAYIVWTAIAVGVAIWVNVNAKPEPRPRDSFYNFDFPSDEALYHGFIFFAWLAGLVLIWAVARLSDRVREERAWAKEREMRER
jgi:hypothetical protein